MKEAARLVKEVLPFPYILGLTCPAPCQKACRRALVEEEIAICRMHGSCRRNLFARSTHSLS